MQISASKAGPADRRAVDTTGGRRLRCRVSGGIVAAALGLMAGDRSASAQDSIDATGAAPWFTPTLSYDADLIGVPRGGARRGTAYVGNVHFRVNANGRSWGLPGTTAFVDLLQIHGGQPSRLVGDAMGVSNIAGPAGAQVEELWLQHNFDNASSLLAGIYDLNSEFYRLRSASLFVNSAFGTGPEFAQGGVAGPSIFPRTAAGLRLALKPGDASVVHVALLNGVPVARPDGSHALFRRGDGVLAVGEAALLSRVPVAPGDKRNSPRELVGRFSSLAPYQDKLAIGAWYFSGRYADLSSQDADGSAVQHRGMSGGYAVGEAVVVGRGETSGRHVSVFTQLGRADPRTNRFGSYVGAGLVGSGFSLLTDAEQIGLSVAHARNGSHYLKAAAPATATCSETAFELSYLTPLSSHVAVQPDIQYVVHPGTDRSIANAWVLQLRIELSF